MIDLSADTDSPPGPDRTPGPDARAGSREWIARCLERARAGEIGALDQVVTELNPLLWHVARGEGLTVDDAVDVVQTTWLELLQRLHEIRSPQTLTAWLITTARRTAWRSIRSHRRAGQARTEVLELHRDSAPSLDNQLDIEERRRVLWRHFQSLSDRCRALLRIVALVDRPDYDEMSLALGMPRGSLGPTRARCLAKLREMLLADPVWSMG